MTLNYFIFLLGIVFVCGGDKTFNGYPVLFPGYRKATQKPFMLKQLDPKRYSSYTSTEPPKPSTEPPKPTQPNEPFILSNSLDYDWEINKEIEGDTSYHNFVRRDAPSCIGSSKHEGLCEDDSEYDSVVEERFNQALKTINLSEDLYNKVWSKIMIDNPGSISSRIGDDAREDPVCPATERLIFPKRGMTEGGDFVFLLNQEKFQQGIKIEECLNLTQIRSNYKTEDGALTCSLTSDTGSQSVCRQKYILKNMLALGPTGANIITESVLIPSCCVCLRRISQNRIGGGGLYEFDENGNVVTDNIANEISSSSSAKNTNMENIYTANSSKLLISLP